MLKQSLIFRQPVTLRDGTRVLLRPLAKEDRQALLDLFSGVSSEELPYLRHDVTDPEVVNTWVDELDFDKVLPIVAVLGARILGEATLEFGPSYKRHIGEVRIYLAKDYRNRGLGTRMVQAIVDIARRKGLLMLEVCSFRERADDVRAFQGAGFVNKYTMEDGYMLPNGELRDELHLVMRLRAEADEY